MSTVVIDSLSLSVLPSKRVTYPALIGRTESKASGITLDTHDQFEYHLPGGDRLLIILNYQSNKPRIVLFTHDHQHLKRLPGFRPNSLVANTMSKLNNYLIRSYCDGELDKAQKEKCNLINDCINDMRGLLQDEREIKPTEYKDQEKLRRKLIALIEKARDKNRELLLDYPLVAEGPLGKLLYDIKEAVQHYEFNHYHAVSLLDQQDYKEHPDYQAEPENTCFVWDSESALGTNSPELEQALYEIAKIYKLKPAKRWKEQPASRFRQLIAPFANLWQSLREKADSLAKRKNIPISVEETLSEQGLLTVTPNNRYAFQGLAQTGYKTLAEMAACQMNSTLTEGMDVNTKKAMKRFINSAEDECWAYNSLELYIKRGREITRVKYMTLADGTYCALPDGDDLLTLTSMKSNPLSWHKRFLLNIQATVTHIPGYFKKLKYRLFAYFEETIYQDFVTHIHQGHSQPATENKQPPPEYNQGIKHLERVLREKQLLPADQSIRDYIQAEFQKNHFIAVKHPVYPHALHYHNPLHRVLGVSRHFFGYFVHVSERNPMAGTIALLAYLYGAGAVIAPNVISALLIKLHLEGLLIIIKPAQLLGKLMGHGTFAESISASATLWQSAILSGNVDTFITNAIELVKENPLELAIILSLAIALGYGSCQGIPSLQKEMGMFNLPTYLTTGGKEVVAAADVVYNPGEDWLFGTAKWLISGLSTLAKIGIAPILEGYHYGIKSGFLPGLKKSGKQILKAMKGGLAASADIILILTSVFLQEIPAMLIHVPFRGISTLAVKVMSTLGHLEEVGNTLQNLGKEAFSQKLYKGIRLSPLYGLPSAGDANLLMKIGRLALHLVKNALLFVSDLLFFGLRGLFQAASMVFGVFFIIAGGIIAAPGSILDKIPGPILNTIAKITLMICDKIDYFVGRIKQWLLSQLSIARCKIYDWAFYTEDHPEAKPVHETTTQDLLMQLSYCGSVVEELIPEEHSLVYKIHAAIPTTPTSRSDPVPAPV